MSKKGVEKSKIYQAFSLRKLIAEYDGALLRTTSGDKYPNEEGFVDLDENEVVLGFYNQVDSEYIEGDIKSKGGVSE